MKSEYPDPSPEPESSHDTPDHDPAVLSQGQYQLPPSSQPPPYHRPPPTMTEPHWFYDSSMGPWQNFFASFEAYTQYEQARRAYILETDMAPPQPQHMGYAGPPLPLEQSTVAYNYAVQRQMLPAPPAPNPLNQQMAYPEPPPHHNAPTTFGPDSAYEQVFRNSMSPYPEPQQAGQFISERGTSRCSERLSGPPLDIINSTLTGAYQHARKPKPPHLKSEDNAMAAANDKKRHYEIIATGIVQDEPCGQCRVRMKNHHEHKCYKIETVGRDGEIKRSRCQYCRIRRQKCAVETAEVAMDRMYGHRHGTAKKEEAVIKDDNEENDKKKEKNRNLEKRKAEAHAIGDARAYNASFRARDEEDSPYDLTQRPPSVPHTPLPAGHPFEAVQRYTQAGPYTQEFIPYNPGPSTFGASPYGAAPSPYNPSPSPYAQTPPARTPVHSASYPPGVPLPFGSAAPFPLPGYSDSLSDNVVGAMNQARRHSGQSIPSPSFVLDPALAEPAAHVARYDHSPQNTYGHGVGEYARRHLRPVLPAPAPVQAQMQYSPLNPNVPGYGEPYNEGPQPSQGMAAPYNYPPYTNIPQGVLDPALSPYPASNPYTNHPLPSLIPPSPSAARLERVNQPPPASRPTILIIDTPESVARRVARDWAPREPGLRVLPSQPEGRRVSASGQIRKVKTKKTGGKDEKKTRR